MTLTACEPPDAVTTAALLADAAASGQVVVPRGSGTKLAPDAARPPALVMSTRGLTGGLAHYAGDLVATAPAGCTLQEVNAALAAERQWIALDPPFGDAATIGGIVSTNDSGPRRHHYGSPRDLIIGIEVALASGRVARSGGRVVKNVAGYDLARLFCGAQGSLGVITAVTFKLAPLAPASRTVIARFDRLADAAAAALRLASTASLTPTAVEAIGPDPRLLVRFESTPGSTERMAAAAGSMLQSVSADVTVVADADERAIWETYQRDESDRRGVAIRAAVLPTATADALDAVARLASDGALTWSVTSRAALGVVRARVNGAPDSLRAFAAALRAAIGSHGGHVQFSDHDRVLGDALDAWESPGAAARVGAAVKQRFDPSGVLPYPWVRG
jgi:glycolate oxidase FAD binding subunit